MDFMIFYPKTGSLRPKSCKVYPGDSSSCRCGALSLAFANALG